jgi:hypothetical protein
MPFKFTCLIPLGVVKNISPHFWGEKGTKQKLLNHFKIADESES